MPERNVVSEGVNIQALMIISALFGAKFPKVYAFECPMQLGDKITRPGGNWKASPSGPISTILSYVATQFLISGSAMQNLKNKYFY